MTAYQMYADDDQQRWQSDRWQSGPSKPAPSAPTTFADWRCCGRGELCAISTRHLEPLAESMTDYSSLPSSVLAKIAALDGHCMTLTTKLEASRRDLQRLRIERRDCVPQTVHDECRPT